MKGAKAMVARVTVKQPLAERSLMSPSSEGASRTRASRTIQLFFWGRTRLQALEREQEGLKRKKKKKM